MKQSKSLFLLLSCSLILAACGNEKQDTVEVHSKETASSETVSKTEKPESKKGTRSNPIPFGKNVSQKISFYDIDGDAMDEFEGTITLSLDNLKRGDTAYSYLKEANEYNEEAPDGFEWAIVDAELSLTDADTDDVAFYVDPDFTVFTEDGSTVDKEIYPTYAEGDEFGYDKIYNGGTSKGKVAFLVPIDEPFLIEYDNQTSHPLFFKPV
ncbi:MAG: DUF4352 domain-containing protein [Pisciglobus halotolerans]|nr:DUF4352 domain-containing protein [Pisciglobus halotolerans]